jgi:hypothetical protein
MRGDMRRFLRTPDAAVYCGLSRRTLEKLRLKGGGPLYSRPRGHRFVVYDVEDLVEWIRAGRQSSTSDPDGTTHSA